MHDLAPHDRWLSMYQSQEDSHSPFYGHSYHESQCRYTVYNHYIHPQWDAFGSETLYLKILFADYQQGFACIELLGEWNDLLGNDCMFLKREVAEPLMEAGIRYFIFLGDYVMDFHAGELDYYEEWTDELEDGWLALIAFRSHVLQEMKRFGVADYFLFSPEADLIPWRTLKPQILFETTRRLLANRLGF